MANLPLLIAFAILLPITVITIINFPNLEKFAIFYPFTWVANLLVFVGIFAYWIRDTSPASIEQLEKRGAIQIPREEIWSIELQDGGFWTPSKIVIVRRSGKKTSLLFAENGAFKQIAPILQRVVPDRAYTYA